MKTFCFALQKGGTGKTSTAVSVAVELAKAGYSTLLIDADPQGNATTWIFNKPIQYDFADLLQDKCTVEQCTVKTDIENLFLIPTAGLDGNLKDVAESAAIQGKPYKIRKLKPTFEKHFNYVIFDLSPSFGTLEKCCLIASDKVITVLECTEFAKDGLEIFTHRLQETKSDLELSQNDAPLLTNIVLNAKDDRKTLHKAIFESFKPLQNNYVINSIPQEPAFEKSQAMHVCLQDFSDVKKETKQAIKDITQSLIA